LRLGLWVGGQPSKKTISWGRSHLRRRRLGPIKKNSKWPRSVIQKAWGGTNGECRTQKRRVKRRELGRTQSERVRSARGGRLGEKKGGGTNFTTHMRAERRGSRKKHTTQKRRKNSRKKKNFKRLITKEKGGRHTGGISEIESTKAEEKGKYRRKRNILPNLEGGAKSE